MMLATYFIRLKVAGMRMASCPAFGTLSLMVPQTLMIGQMVK